MITLDNLREAQSGLAGVGERTPLIRLPLSIHPHPQDAGSLEVTRHLERGQSPSREVRLKAEHLQPIGAFKIRGAWTALRRLSDDARRRGVVTSSSGNHGLGIAFAAKRLGIRAVVVMPESAAGVKIDGVRRLGAEVVLAGKTRGPEQSVAAQRYVTDESLTMVPPYDHPDVIAGQGTVGLEILDQWPEVQAILVPIGGGGLLAGICSAVRATGADVAVIAVEPADIPKLSTAMAAGGPTTLPGGASLADGLLTKSVGQVTWPLIKETVRAVVSVTDDEIRAAVRWLNTAGLRVEPSGSVTTAAILAAKYIVTGPTVVVCSGGNVDAARFEELIAG